MPITITTWNIQNFSEGDDVFEDKLSYLAGILRALGSDVVALQEIRDLGALEALADELEFHHVAASSDGRIRVAVLTRNPPVGPPVEINQWQLEPGVQVQGFDSDGNLVVLPQFRRAALEVTIAHGGGQIDVVTAHLKSKLLSFGGNFSTTDETLRARTAYFALQLRAAEATSLREHVTGRLAAGRHVVVLGDMNDGPEAATTQILYGPVGSQPRGPDDATHATGAFQLADNSDPQRLFNVTNLVPADVRWSRRHSGQNELLDHILAGASLMPRQNGLRQVPVMSILNEDTPSLIPSRPTLGGVIPDHAPVTATFAI